uniref:Uncharacterized protein n=1 Tax=Panagrolaimus sp. PS1159 TaxID=55785 RepID=A0AC35F8B6_9BILA
MVQEATQIPFEPKQISKDLSQTLYNVTLNITKANITLNFIESILCNAVIICVLIILLLIYWNIKMWLTHKNKEDDFIRRKLEERMFDVQKRRKIVKNDVKSRHEKLPLFGGLT